MSTVPEPATARSEAVPVFRVMTPPVAVDALAGVALPDRVSIAAVKSLSEVLIPIV